MPAIDPVRSVLLVVDFQSRLMPAIDDGATVIVNARRIIDGAELFGIPILFTEQNTKGLGGTLPELHARTAGIAHKMTFDACQAPDFMGALGDRTDIVVAGCEAHVCVSANRPGPVASRATGLRGTRCGWLAPIGKQGNGASANGAEWG